MFSELLFLFFAVLIVSIIDYLNTLFGAILFGFIVYYYVNLDSDIFRKPCITSVANRAVAALTLFYRVVENLYRFCRQLSRRRENADCLPSDFAIQFCGNRATLENEINVLVIGISQYYVKSWYHKISKNEDFVFYLKSNIRDTLMNLCTTVSQLDKKKYSMIIIQIYLNFFSHFVEAKKKSEVFKRENFEMRHWAMKDDLTEWCYLQSLMSTLLDSFCLAESERSLNSKYSPLLHNVVVEILAQNILQPVVKVLCNPAHLNLMLLKLFTKYTEKGNQENLKHDAIVSRAIALTEEPCNSKPVILFSNEESSDDSVFIDDREDLKQTETKPKSRSFISENCNTCNVQRLNSEIDQGLVAEKSGSQTFLNEETCRFEWLNPEKKRSSSNINLFDAKFSDLIAHDPAAQKDFNIKCTTIKRSKSADYIRQIPLLKALNGEDYSIIVKGDKKMVVSFKSDSYEYIQQAGSTIQVEMPTLFTDINITDTYQETEAVVPYTVYCIQYTGMFHDLGRTAELPHLLKHVIEIKKRFSQFVSLHSSLEANPSLKGYLRGIKGPSKWMFPLTNLDKKNIAERRSFLEKYLRELSSLAPVAKSTELQEFLSYGGDVRVSPVRKSSDIGVSKIDKMVKRGVKDAYVMFKSSLPNSSEEDDRITLTPRTNADFHEYLVDIISRDPDICEHMRNFRKIKMKTTKHEAASMSWKPNKSSILRNVQGLSTVTSCKCSVANENFLLEEQQFGNIVLELIAISLNLNENDFGDLLSLLKPLCTPCIDRFFEKELDNSLEDHMIKLVHMLHNYLWPTEKNNIEQVVKMENSEIYNKVLENLEGVLSSKLAILDWCNPVKEILIDKITLFFSSFQQQEANKCLLFHLFDSLIEQICFKEL